MNILTCIHATLAILVKLADYFCPNKICNTCSDLGCTKGESGYLALDGVFLKTFYKTCSVTVKPILKTKFSIFKVYISLAISILREYLDHRKV